MACEMKLRNCMLSGGATASSKFKCKFYTFYYDSIVCKLSFLSIDFLDVVEIGICTG